MLAYNISIHKRESSALVDDQKLQQLHLAAMVEAGGETGTSCLFLARARPLLGI